MTFPTRHSLADGAISPLSRFARLDLSEDRAAAIAPVVDGVMALIDTLDSIDVGETPPATAFDARWE